MSLVRDYEAILDQQLVNPAFETTFSLAPRPMGRELPRVPSLDERFDVVPCDPTQATAIAEARRGESYIIQGPPGTGKSQTITNLVADFVARGKRVLFVCEKRAAIDVVFARLKQCGLGPLCSLIHDSQTDKREFILDLKQTYELFTEESPATTQASSRTALLRKLNSNLRPLAKFEEAMEGEAAPAGLPLRRFLDRCVRLADTRPQLTPELSERLPTYHQWWPYSQRSDVDQLIARIVQLRQAGLTLKQVAKQLNRAGVSSLRGRPFTNYMVSKLLVQRGLYFPSGRKRPESVALTKHEWWAPDLAEMLEMPRPSLNHWFDKGWVRGRKLPGLRGRLILWADEAEIDRLQQLRRSRRGWSDAPYPTELTTPKQISAVV